MQNYDASALYAVYGNGIIKKERGCGHKQNVHDCIHALFFCFI